MSDKDFGLFSVGIAMRYDVDAIELEYIMAAEGLTEENSFDEIREAVSRTAHWTPIGPIYDWEAIIAKAKANGYNPD